MSKKTLEQIHAEHAKALAEHAHDEVIERALADAGATLTPKHVHHFKPVPWVSFAAKPADACALLESLSDRAVYGLCARERGCLSVAPEEFQSKEYAEAHERWRVGTPGVELTVSAGRGFYSCELTMHVDTSVGPLRVKVDVEGAWNLHPRSEVSYTSDGDVSSATHEPPTVTGYAQKVKWGSGSRDACRFSFYFDQLSELRKNLVPEMIAPR